MANTSVAVALIDQQILGTVERYRGGVANWLLNAVAALADALFHGHNDRS